MRNRCPEAEKFHGTVGKVSKEGITIPHGLCTRLSSNLLGISGSKQFENMCGDDDKRTCLKRRQRQKMMGKGRALFVSKSTIADMPCYSLHVITP